MRSSVVFCNSVSADHTVVAASRLLRAVAAFVILLSFAAGLRKSYWSGCMKAAAVICQPIFSILALMIFLLKILLKSASKSSFFRLASRSGFGATISDAVARSSFVFCNSVYADRIVMAVSRLLRAVAALVILLSFAAGSRKSYWSGCMKAATWICQQIFSILALVIFLLKMLLKSASKSSFFSLWRRDPVLELQFPTPLCVVFPKTLLKSASKSSFFRSGVENRFWSYNFRRRCA